MKTITDRIKTVEDARKETGRPEIDFSFLPEDMREYFQELYDAIVIIEALNEGWKPDWDNYEYKWLPWFLMSPSGFAFDVSRYAFSVADASSGSRLRLKSEELSNYMAKQFPDIWKKVQLA